MMDFDFEEIRQKLKNKADDNGLLWELNVIELNHYDGWADSTEAFFDERINTEDAHFLEILVEVGIIEPINPVRTVYRVLS